MGKPRKLKFGEHRYKDINGRARITKVKNIRNNRVYSKAERLWLYTPEKINILLKRYRKTVDYETIIEQPELMSALEISVYGVVKHGSDYAIFDHTFFVDSNITPEKIKIIMDKLQIWQPYEKDIGLIQMDSRVIVAGQQTKIEAGKIVHDIEKYLTEKKSAMSFKTDEHGHGSRKVVKSNKSSQKKYQNAISDYEEGVS